MIDQTKPQHIGFIGAGKMATALAVGFLEQKAVFPEHLRAADVHEASREAFAAATGIRCANVAQAVVPEAQIIFLAVKPQVIKQVCGDIAELLQPDQLVVSIAAGVTLADLSAMLGNHQQLIRVMPNTPALVGAGAAGLAAAASVPDDSRAFVSKLFETVGICCEVPESSLDAVTGLSGSGPAYVFQMLEAMSDGGVLMGLPRDTATQLAAQTVLGAAKMLLETGQHPGALKDAVTSPGGTTIAGITELERGGLRATMINAVQAATLRSRELANS